MVRSEQYELRHAGFRMQPPPHLPHPPRCMALPDGGSKGYGSVVLPRLLRHIQHPPVMPVHPISMAIGTPSVAAAGTIKSPALPVRLVACAAHGGGVGGGRVLEWYSPRDGKWFQLAPLLPS